MGKQWKQCQTLFFWAPKSLQMVTAAMKLKDAYSLEGKLYIFWAMIQSLPPKTIITYKLYYQSHLLISHSATWISNVIYVVKFVLFSLGLVSPLLGVWPTLLSEPISYNLEPVNNHNHVISFPIIWFKYYVIPSSVSDYSMYKLLMKKDTSIILFFKSNL